MINKELFGKIKDLSIYKFTLKYENIYVQIINYGGIITNYYYDDVDVVLGYDTLEEYINTTDYYGATVGRVCNRIADGKFTLNGKVYHLAINNGNNSLHGGLVGFNKRIFDYEIKDDKLILSYLSIDQEEGYPGNLLIKVIYYLDEEGLHIEYNGKCDQDTICNLTNHSYFNLNGDGCGDILNHDLVVLANYILPINDNYVPTGSKMEVKNTPFDFNESTKIGKRINDNHPQLIIANGYDHAYVLNEEGLRKVATLTGDISNLKLDVITDQLAMQLYSSNFVNNDHGKHGHIYQYRSAICLETSGYPNAVNCKEYPSVILKKGDTYTATTIYKLYK